jgi:high frequency lysogenization protein
MVDGEHHILNVQENADKIRALLLAAVRSAVLWRQCGGSRWQMLFKRDQLIAEAEAVIEENRPTYH